MSASQNDGSDVIKLLFDAMMRSSRTSMVVRIESYNAGERTADVTPMVQEERKIDGEYVSIPSSSIPGCPVLFWGGKGNSFVGGLQKDDLCLALYRHRSHDEIDNGDDGPIVPESTRRLDLADIIVIGSFVAPANGLESDQFREDGQPVLAMPEVSSLYVGGSDAGYTLVRNDLLRQYLISDRTWKLNHKHLVADVLSAIPNSAPPAIPSNLDSERIKVDK